MPLSEAPLNLGRWLLEPEMFSDVAVKCGASTWKLHKSHLCSKSHWFRTALTGGFKEAQTSVITIDESDPELLFVAITWMYTGELDSEVFENGDEAFAALLKLYETADFFLIPELRDSAITRTKMLLRERAIAIQNRFCTIIGSGFHFLAVGGEDTTGLLEGVRLAYESEIEALGVLWVQFVKATMFWVLTNDDFFALCTEIPRFGLKVLVALRDTNLTRGGLLHNASHDHFGCIDCHSDPFRRSGGHYVSLSYRQEGSAIIPLGGHCNHCRDDCELFE
ncbi:BTB/POZ protein [Hypoxylon trugodes]|uniref:BTB/POZ protein n=1 Tax=Hypoxylon trugodes TaxID=326681 RepID=UPI00218DF3BC|nr:BTB/POZ protein [Hypoxylon trugodes]KAI1390819.1 BTB/POZ protein [Hypoxylon trugodes]